MTDRREGFVPEEFLGQIKDVDGNWVDYSRGTEAEAVRWFKGDTLNRRVVDWIYKERVLYPTPTPPRQDEDGTPYLSYFVREPVMASFCWSGRPDQPIEVAYAEAGEPIDARFAAWGALLEAGTVSELLTKFQQQCNEHLAHINREDA